ncbi:hypothetical protein PoB_007204100 [Plakobranchus ocellatus]|uniref:Uncharacterized protein n=1 Tax=Plakobranchus ocellatus TaxID=259542 RepID=A0AAV4DNM1_9GAST|nr:hypothetical protein PoB_007204100 [Plakobranchus ocellatus]
MQGSWGVGGTVSSESALRSAVILLLRVRAPPPAPWPDGGPESLRSPFCRLAVYKNQPSSNSNTNGYGNTNSNTNTKDSTKDSTNDSTNANGSLLN